MKGKSPHAFDGRVGNRLRMRRIVLYTSQEQIAKKLGISFQQVQKYENGGSRISSSRPHQIAGTLGCRW